MKILGYNNIIELILSITYLIIPIILPMYDNSFQPSISDYAHTSSVYIYNITLGVISLLTIIDGLNNRARMYNLLIGLSLLGVIIFPVLKYRIIHDIFAVIFFLGNAYIVIYHSKLLKNKQKKINAFIITFVLSLLFFGVVNLFVAESIGMFSMSYFMWIRYSILNLKGRYLLNNN